VTSGVRGGKDKGRRGTEVTGAGKTPFREKDGAAVGRGEAEVGVWTRAGEVPFLDARSVGWGKGSEGAR
jgi:hypothetical protein